MLPIPPMPSDIFTEPNVAPDDLLLDRPATPSATTLSAEAIDNPADRAANHTSFDQMRICPCCQQRCLVRVRRIYPKQACGP